MLVLTGALIFAGGQGEKGTATATNGAEITLPYQGPEVTFTYFCEGTDEQAAKDRSSALWQELKKRLGNINIEFHGDTKEGEDQRLALMYASGLEYDLIRVREPARAIPPIAASGILLNFSDYKKYMPNLEKLRAKLPSVDLMLDEEGNRYCIAQMMDQDRPYQIPIANKTLFDKYGVKLPIKTSDEWLDVIKKMEADDPSIVSISERWAGVWNITWVLGGMFSNGVGVQFTGYDREKKEWYFGPTSPDRGFKETLQWMHEVYKVGGFSPIWLTMTGDQWTQMTQSGKVAVNNMYVSSYGTYGPTAPRLKEGDYEVEFFPLPHGPKGIANSYVGAFYDSPGYFGTAANAKTEHPELLCAMLDYFVSDEATELFGWGIEGVTYRKVNGKNEWMPDIKVGANPNGTKPLDDFMGMRTLPLTGIVTKMKVEYSKAYQGDAWKIIRSWVDRLATGWYTAANITWQGEAPLLSAEEGERVGEEMGPVNTHLKENMVKFVTGDRSFDEWDQFQKELNNLGDIKYVLDLYASKKPPKKYPRNWAAYWD